MAIEFKHILVPVDFDVPGQRALDAATDLARRLGSRLTLVHVCEIPAYAYSGMTFAATDLIGPIQDLASEHLAKAQHQIEAKVPGTKAVLRTGSPASEILRTIEEVHPDVVVMGTHGRKGLTHALLGSVAEKVVRLSPVPVLTVRGS